MKFDIVKSLGGSILDQVIVTIISSAVVLIAALGGGAIGAILTNRYAQRQDKRRKETEVIEELYGLAIKVRTSVDAYLLAGPNSTLSDFPVPESMLRMTVLTDLYLHSLTPRLEEFWNRIKRVENARKSSTYEKDNVGSAIERKPADFDQVVDSYRKSFNTLRETLQDLAKKQS